jgi:lysozyme
MSTPPTPLVLDLSHHNTVESLKPAAAAGVIGVVHKATQGVGMVDEKYPARRFLAREAGLLWGAYHYLTATSVDLQVSHFLFTVKEGDTYPLLVLDFEERGVSLTVAASFVRLVQQETGAFPVLYAGDYLKDLLANGTIPPLALISCPLWLAQYSSAPIRPPGWPALWLWQYSDEGVIPGIYGHYDVSTGDPEKVRALWTAPGTGLKAPPPPPGEITLTVPKGTPYRVLEV